ncbi:ABC transporter permease [Spiroplasma cantharicola]|uniref:ABC transporter permease n=1 Tax=Spiroplasma cantharicola TaxID=362837 RepID=A0A0M5KEN8_9MOLU|nr:FtsX-like permease family protein [Spiroplasma cantharicola]ALD66813.1 ABC transporter permease [Spiroplasma cantharicola]
MKGIRLLLKNAFKSAGKNKSQIIGLSLLVMLVSLVISVLGATSTRVVGAYNQLNSQSNLRDYVVDINMEDKILEPDENGKDIKEWEIDGVLSKDDMLYQQYIMNQIALKYNLDVSFTEARLISGLYGKKGDIRVKAISKINSDINMGVDKLVVSKGRTFKAEAKEVVIGESYAKQNGIKVGDIVRVNTDKYGKDLLVKNTEGNSPEVEQLKKDLREMTNVQTFLDSNAYRNQVWFEVVGIGTSADFTTPIMDATTIMPNINNEVLMYMDSSWMGYESIAYNFTKINNEGSTARNEVKKTMASYIVSNAKVVVTSENDRETYISVKAANGSNSELLNNLEKEYKTWANIKLDSKYIYDSNDSLYKFSTRITTFKSIMTGYNSMATALIIVIVAIAGFTTVLTTKKQVELQSKQIGCLKSLGYKKREIVNNFIAIPLIVSILGALLGYIISIFIETLVVSIFSNYFNIAFLGFKFNIVSFGTSIIGLWIGLTLLAFIIGYWTIRLPALTLLQGGDDKVINKFSMSIKSLFKKRGFNTRLKTALLTTSMGKLAGVSATMLLSATLITTTIIAPKVMKDNMTATFNGMNYENMVEYTQPIANNPWSFQRTYNPNWNSEKEGWGQYEIDKMVKIKNSGKEGNKGITDGWTPYPVKEIESNPTDAIKHEIDWANVYSSLLEGNISPYYYTYDIAKDDKFFWTEFSYLNWKNMSTKLLQNLDRAEVSGFTGGIALSQLQAQWPDYIKLTDNIKNLKDPTASPSTLDLKTYSRLMLQVYSKYIKGLKLTYNEGMIDRSNPEELLINASKAQNKLNSVFKTKKTKNYWDLNKNEKNTMQINEDFTADFKFKWNGEFISPLEINESDLESVTDENILKDLNRALTLWFGSVLDGRMGTAVLQTTYTRSPYFVQEYIKSAIENNENYNITFNLIPYDNNKDELGTMLNSNFLSKNGKVESAKIFGVEKDSKLVSLKNARGLELSSTLFKNEVNDFVPLIINESFSKKINKEVGQTISLKVLRELLKLDGENKDLVLNEDVKYGHNLVKDNKLNFNNEFRTQSTYAYYSNGGIYADNSSAILGRGVDSSTIGDINIAAKYADKATNPIDVYEKYKDGTLRVNSKYENVEFVIAGVQNGYGQPQGWISNEKANQILEYDQVKKYNFQNWFAREYPQGNPLYKLEQFSNGDEEKIQGVTLEEFIQEVYDGKRTYEDFIANVQRSKPGSSWRNMNQLYDNLYPIFNYKYSEEPEIIDLTQGFSVSSKIGDFSSVGLNGSFETKQVPCSEVESTDADENECTIVDPEKFNQGYGIGTLSTMLPKEQTRQILGQVTDLINLIIIMFITIAIIVSATIILLTTSLIIFENKQFIATMKTLGYSNGYVVRQILGMYIAPIMIMYVIGFIAGWYIFVIISDFLALNTAWVLPVNFSLWLPFSVFGVIATIYVVTFTIGWKNIQKINPLEALKDKD